MGFLTKLFGGADGIRETMRESYLKHVRLAQEGSIGSDDPPHANWTIWRAWVSISRSFEAHLRGRALDGACPIPVDARGGVR